MPIILLIFLSAVCSVSYGQLSIISVHLNTTLISPSTLFSTILSNTGSNSRFWLEGDLIDSQGESVLSFQTIPLDMATGTRTYQASDLAMRTYRYAASETGRNTQVFQRLPNGTYTFCLKLRSDSEGEDRLCENELVDEFLVLDLIHPWNRDTIEETRPTLTWSLSSSGAPNAAARLVVSPMPNDRTPTQAMAAERPHFMVPNVSPGPIPYPAGLPDLERGKCYAWQVEVVDGDRVKDRSEPWGFCVRSNQRDPSQKFVLLDGNDLANHSAIDDVLYFRFDEQYHATAITCSVVDEKGVTHYPIADKMGKDHEGRGAKSIGPNLYSFDLNPYRLTTGNYSLVVRDEKARSNRIRFCIDR